MQNIQTYYNTYNSVTISYTVLFMLKYKKFIKRPKEACI